MKVMYFSRLLERAVGEGMVAAALVDRDGNTVGLAGAITEDVALPLAALVMYRLKSDNLAARLFAGEILSLTLDDRDVAVGIAKRQLFVVAVLGPATTAALAVVRDLRHDVEEMLPDNDVTAPPPWSSGGGSSSCPAELQLIEFGISVRRERGKA